MRAGANLNIIYPEKSHDNTRNGLKILDVDATKTGSKKRESSAKNEAGRDYRCTIAINTAKHNLLNTGDMINSFRVLL